MCADLRLNPGIVTPVTLCMAITVLLVRILNPDGASNSNTMRLATAYYDEKVGTSEGTSPGPHHRRELVAYILWLRQKSFVGAGIGLRDNEV